MWWFQDVWLNPKLISHSGQWNSGQSKRHQKGWAMTGLASKTLPHTPWHWCHELRYSQCSIVNIAKVFNSAVFQGILCVAAVCQHKHTMRDVIDCQKLLCLFPNFLTIWMSGMVLVVNNMDLWRCYPQHGLQPWDNDRLQFCREQSKKCM